MPRVLAPPARHRRTRDGAAGFLLTETLATFTISAFVLLGLVSAASVLLRAVDGSVGRVERVDDLGRALDSIRLDIAAVARARWNGTEPQPYVFRGSANSLYFAEVTPAAGGPRGAIAVALREIVVDGRPTLVRTTARLGARATSFADLEFGPQKEVWTGTARLRFGYVPQSDGERAPTARASWPVGTKLPAAVLIEAVDRETRSVLVTTRVTIQANADIGCLTEDDPNPSAPASVTQSDPSRQGAAPTGDPSQPAPAPTPAATPAQTAASQPFCSQSQEAGDKQSKATPAAPTGAPQ